MQQIFNGTPEIIKGRAQGVPYLFSPGEVKQVPDEHAKTLIRNYGAVGLREMHYGDEVESVRAQSIAVWREHTLAAIRDFNRFNLDQARQGLKPSSPIPELEKSARMYRQITGMELKLSAEGSEDGDPMLTVIRNVARASQKLGDTPEARKFKAVLEQLAEVKAEADETTGTTAEDEAEMLDVTDQIAPKQATKMRARRRGRPRKADRE